MLLLPRYQPITDLPRVKSSAVTKAPIATSRQGRLRSGRILYMAPKSSAMMPSEITKFTSDISSVISGAPPRSQVLTIEMPALTASETSRMKPVAATSPMLAALARNSRLTVSVVSSSASGSTFQMALSAPWSSPNTPLAVSNRVTSPTTVAMVPLVPSLAPRTMSWMVAAPWSPIRPRSWSSSAPRTASSPKKKPAMAVAMTISGATEKMV